ncbi:MAG: recombinase family protein [Chitinophagales bacterium]
MYDLFLLEKRVKTVVKQLNTKGFRTMSGSDFTATTVERLLRDPIAMGERRANYTKSTGDGKKWELKPESEWVFMAAPAIITKDAWEKCFNILTEHDKTIAPRTKKAAHLFAGFLTCHCGGKMYVPSRTKKYKCVKCKQNSIATEDIEAIYYEHLEAFLLTKNDMVTFQSRANETIQKKNEELQTLIKERDKVKDEMDNLIKLHSKG